MNVSRLRPMIPAIALLLAPLAARAEKPMPGGELSILNEQGQPVGACPLKYTDVVADVVGYVARVTVVQTFHNPLPDKIEAIYTFPLPDGAAVDSMVMTVGERRILGQIKPREEARDIYEAAKAAGHVASLLDQERPNIFTQSVANIEPGVEVEIEISYVETLKYDHGEFTWVFPTVVGPRYMPGAPTSRIPDVAPEHEGKVHEAPRPDPNAVPAEPQRPMSGDAKAEQENADDPKGAGWSPDTDEVPDASRISPPVVKPGYRAGHDISLSINIEAGVTIQSVESELHDVSLKAVGTTGMHVSLTKQAEIPNRDFILKYRLATDEILDAFLMHEGEHGKFFTLVLHPPARVVPAEVVPRELVFVLDTSGSMRGLPIEKAKDVMSRAIDAMGPHDTFNLVTFAGSTHVLWPEPRSNTAANRTEAQQFLASQQGHGGTEMMTAINTALAPTDEPEGIRIVCFMTDGYVGNDMAIIDAVKNNAATTRVFSFGIGNSVNRFLLDGMAWAGRGEVEYVPFGQDADVSAAKAEQAAQRFHERILAPVLTDISIDWGDLPVADVFPQQIPDLFTAKPIMIHGKLTGDATGTITLRGNTGAGEYEEQIAVTDPEVPADHSALASLWARANVEQLMRQDYQAAQMGAFPDDLKQQVIDLGVQYSIMTQFTSFVAVEEQTITVGGEPRTIMVPVDMPEGVSHEGVFGTGDEVRVGLGFAGPARAGKSAQTVRRLAPPSANGGAQFRGFRGGAAGSRMAEGAADAEGRFGERKDAPILGGELEGLAEKVEKEGKDGDLTIGKIKVVDYRVDVMLYLREISDDTLKKLEELGFKKQLEQKSVGLLIGSIDVRKLKELSKLDAVIRIKPVE